MDSLMLFSLVLNAAGNPRFEALGALSFGFGLEVVGTAVSATCRTSLKKPPTGEFITSRGYILIFRAHIVSGVAMYVFEVLCFLQDRLGGVLRLHRSLTFAGLR